LLMCNKLLQKRHGIHVKTMLCFTTGFYMHVKNQIILYKPFVVNY